MSEFDIHTKIEPKVALDSQDITTNTTTVGNIIDTLGFEAIDFQFQSGVVTDGTYTFILEQGDEANLSDAAVVPSELVLGDLTGFTSSDDNAVKHVGSIGKKRFQRVSILSAGTSTGATDMSAIAILGNPKVAPTAD